ncbi:hypothetical protein DN069_13595 [Streptacidiphilus pinicola]|uniref:Uncharacterized protein n=1 Tax=Streptacidiphilus pinicola TaxID=2219663 RepID=A0A2X0J4E2_9ACTN|nr:hypothetical protein [Streptacidiphilus pinicola]RAG85096.1 hypothetical protein DN069_13595 [Streptacidiphilus pinicola]
MSSSGLIYAVIVGAWAAYLVPMWLRRQDELNEARPTERFSTAIRLLSGRAAMERKISRQMEETQPLALPTPLPEAPARPASAAAVDARPAAVPSPADASRRRAALLARRRRMVVILFVAFTAGMVVAAVGGIALLWIPAVPAVLFSLYIAQMRRQEHRRYEVKLDRRRAVEAAQRVRQQAAARREAETVAVRSDASRGARAPRASAESPHAAPRSQANPANPAGPATPAEPTNPGSPAREADHAGGRGAGHGARPTTSGTGTLGKGTVSTGRAEPWADDDRPEHAAAAGAAASPADEGWDPVPVPLPTYVTAPVAPRATLGLDLSAPDTYSAARGRQARPAERTPVAQPNQQTPPAQQARPNPAPRRPAPKPATPLFDQYADDTPRAANE